MKKSLLQPLPNGHSLFSPSAGGRWTTCPGSIQLIAKLLAESEAEPGPMSIYAAEGTLMHLAGANSLLGKPSFKLNSKFSIDGHKLKFTKEFKEAADQYVDVVKWFLTQYPGTLHVEQKVDLSAYEFPSIKGTADVIIDACPVLIVGDFKGGAGVQVSARDNVQTKIYSAAYLSHDLFLYNKVINFIVQPRHRNSDFYEAVEYTTEEIEDFMKDTVLMAIDQALSDNPPFRPSESACKWCEAKENLICDAFNDFGFKQAQKDFTAYKDFKPDPVHRLSPEELSDMLKALPLLNEFISALNMYALDQLQKGIGIPGYELKEGRANRKWSVDNIKKMAKILKDQFHLKHGEIYTKKLNGPANIEKLVKNPEDREKLFEYIIKPKGKPTIGTVDDPRNGIEPENTPQKDFEHDLLK